MGLFDAQLRFPSVPLPPSSDTRRDSGLSVSGNLFLFGLSR